MLDTDGEYLDFIGTAGNDVFSAQYTGSGTNQWLIRRGSTTLFSGQLPTETTAVRILATSGSDTITVTATSGADTLEIGDQTVTVNGFTVVGQSTEAWNLFGGSGLDTLVGPDTNNVWTIDDLNDGTLNESTSFFDVESLTGGAGDDTFRFTGDRNDYIFGTLDTGEGWDTLDYSQFATNSSVTVDWANNRATGVGSNATSGAANGFEAVIGSGGINQSVFGPDSVNQWMLSGENSATINAGQYSITNFGRLFGGPQEDVFYVDADALLTGYLGGSSNDRIELADRGTPLDVNVSPRSIPGVLGSFFAGELLIEGDNNNRLVGGTNNVTLTINADGTFNSSSVDYIAGFNQFVGGTGTESLYGPDVATDWHITADGSGYVVFDGKRFDFTAAENLYGGSAVDSFTVEVGGSWSGAMFGQGGDDTFSILDGNVGSLDGGLDNDTFNLSGGSVNLIQGHNGTDILIGPDTNSAWTIDDRNIGTLNATTSFYNVESLTGGSGDDTFRFTGDGNDYIFGTLDTGEGWDTLDYSQFATNSSVSVDWANNRATGVGTTGSGTVGAATNFESVFGRGQANDRVEGPDAVNRWRIVGEDHGSINAGQYAFAFVNLVGGPQEDVFFIENNALFNGTVSGSTDDRIEVALRSTPLEVNGADRTIPGILGGFSIGNVVSLAPFGSRLLGSDANTNWFLTDTGDVRVGTTNYTGFGEIVGGSGNDTLTINYTGGDLGVTWESSSTAAKAKMR